uniref:Reverse transcriptase zinc-binding domain-containing protein n=1 Tax=Lactuca sativa TaxID=4236 RepID=A0A9R1XUU7_LACSA|nr:hypothetical protein LSAT_V11C200051060 [Lactuca sativa]
MVRRKILSWCEIDDMTVTTVSEFIDLTSKWGNRVKCRKRLIAICYGMLWVLWKSRNNRLFQRSVCFPTQAVEDTKSLVYLWIKCRGRK